MLGKQRHFYGFFMGFDLPRFCYRYVDDQAETRYTPSLYNNISVSFRAYLALAGCWENRDIFTGFLRVFTPPFLDPLQRKRDIPPPCIIIFLLVFWPIWHLQDVGKTETFLRVFFGFLDPNILYLTSI